MPKPTSVQQRPTLRHGDRIGHWVERRANDRARQPSVAPGPNGTDRESISGTAQDERLYLAVARDATLQVRTTQENSRMSDAWLETLSLEECTQRLRAANVGRIGVIHDGSPVVLPVNYKLVETTTAAWIALRTRPGNVIDQPGAPVALEIDNIDPADHRGWSVLVRGTLHHAADAGDFRDRFDPQPWLDVERDAWLLIETSSITGRQLHVAEPIWAFHITAYL
jgi:hypothetical protein